jgi:Regulatory CLIP domain of proteinases
MILTLDPCNIPSTNEAGECIPLIDCQGLAEEYKRDRTHAPTICNKLLRKVCCPLRFVPRNNADPIQQNITSTTTVSTTESDSDDSEPFIASQIIKSTF